MFNQETVNTLDVNNYYVRTETNDFYLFDGVWSLKKFAEQFKVNYERLALELLEHGEAVLDNGVSISVV